MSWNTICEHGLPVYRCQVCHVPSKETISEQRAREKQESRDADEAALAAGTITPRELERKNMFLDPRRCRVRWDKGGRLK